jgi:hypothetical protein
MSDDYEDDRGFYSGCHVRCPKCGHFMGDPCDLGLYEEGEHELSCDHCGEDFAVESSSSWTFTSPPMQGPEEPKP